MLNCLIKVLVRFWAISWAKCRFHPHFRENAWKKGKSWLSFPPFTKNAPRLSLRRTIFAQGCRWDTTFTLFSRIFTKMWVKTYIYLTKSPKNRTKNFDQTMQQNVVQSAGVNAQFHEFAEKRCQFCPNMWLHNIWLFELLKYLTQHRLCINTHTLNNVYQMSF